MAMLVIPGVGRAFAPVILPIRRNSNTTDDPADRNHKHVTGAQFMDPYVHNRTRSTKHLWAFLVTTAPYYASDFTTIPTTTETVVEGDRCSERTSSTSGTSMIGMNLLLSFGLFVVGILIFYVATVNTTKKERKRILERRMSTGSDWVRTFYAQKIVDEKPGSSQTSSESLSDVVDGSSSELGFWLPVFWFWKTEELERRCGKSATQYLRFVEYLIFFASLVAVGSMLLVLPVNLRGTMLRTKMEFGRTTMINVDPRSRLLWVHVTLSVVLFPLALFFATRFVRTFRGYSRLDKSSKTLMITNLSKKHATEEKINQHFQEAHPNVEVSKVNLTFHTNELHQLDKELQLCTSCLKYYEKSLLPGDDRPIYYKDNLCVRCCCCCCDVGVDALEHYSSKATDLENRIELLIDQPQKITSTFFVTFEAEDVTAEIYYRYRTVFKSLFSQKTSVSGELHSKIWKAKYAPHPDLIKWHNLQSSGLTWWIRAIILNVGYLVFLFFVTSPVIILNALGISNLYKNILIVKQIIPALLLLELGFVIGSMTRFVTNKTRYHDKIEEMLVRIRGTYSFGLVAQLLLPTFGLTSVKALYDYLVQSTTAEDFNWSCVFMPDYGMVFVTYFIFQSLFATSLKFSRITDLQALAFRRTTARSKAEKWLLSQRKRPFSFTQGYARSLGLFTITIVFAFVVPFAGPFGLFALIMNHIAERYSIFFIYKRIEAPNPVHRAAVNLFLTSVLLQLYFMIFFTAIRNGTVGLATLTTMAVLYTIALIYIAWREEFGRFTKLHASSIGSKFFVHTEDDDDESSFDPVHESQEYEAPILRRYEILRPLTRNATQRQRSASQ